MGHVYLGMELGGACVAVWQCKEDHSLEGASMVHSALNLPSLLECRLLGYLKMKYGSKSYTTL